jgi:rhamnosyltransferase
LLLQNADISQFDYIALCDQDDIWFDQKLTHACATLKRSDAGAYSCNSVAFWPDGKQVMIRKDYPMRQWDHFFESASHGCTYVLTSETIKKFQHFIEIKRPAIEEIEFHDWLLYAWARQQGIPWYMDKAHLIYYRQHETNELGVNSGWKALFLRLRQLRTGRLRQQSLLIVNALEANAFKLKSVLEVPGFANRLHLASCTFALRRRRRDALLLMLAIILFGI